MSPNNSWARNPILGVGLLGLLLIVGYALFVASSYLMGPSITVLSPTNDSTVSSPTVVVSGKTARVAIVTLNGQPIPLLEDGTFSVERAFPTGYTVLTIRARDRFQREEVETIRFLNNFKPRAHGESEEGI